MLCALGYLGRSSVVMGACKAFTGEKHRSLQAYTPTGVAHRRCAQDKQMCQLGIAPAYCTLPSSLRTPALLLTKRLPVEAIAMLWLIES